MSIADDPRIARGMAAELDARRRKLAAGDTSLGWKVGFGSPAAMERLAITTPLVGFLTRGALLRSGATIQAASWAKPGAEPEIAVHMGRDLPGGADRPAVRAAIAALGPAIEIVDLDAPPDDPERVLAGNIYQRHVILGEKDPARAGASLDGLTARVTHGGREIAAPSDLQANIGEIVGIVRLVADTLAAFGETLRAGEVIITGSVVPPLWIEGDQEVSFQLGNAPAISARFRQTAA